MNTFPGVADTLGYLQHHLQELTECQNASEHGINTTLMGLTAQLQQLIQLMTGPAPAPIVALPPIPVSPPSVSPSFLGLATPSVRGSLGGTQNTLDYSRGGILS